MFPPVLSIQDNNYIYQTNNMYGQSINQSLTLSSGSLGCQRYAGAYNLILINLILTEELLLLVSTLNLIFGYSKRRNGNLYHLSLCERERVTVLYL